MSQQDANSPDLCDTIRIAAAALASKREAIQYANNNTVVRGIFGKQAEAVIATRDKNGHYWVCGRECWVTAGRDMAGAMPSGYPWANISDLVDVVHWLDACDEYHRAKAAIPLPPKSIDAVVYHTEGDTGLLNWFKSLFR